MNVLFVSLEFLLPPDRGLRVRSLSQLKLLCSLDAVESVTFVSLRDGEIDRDKVRALEKELPKLRVLDAVFQPIHMRRHPRYVPRLPRRRKRRKSQWFRHARVARLPPPPASPPQS